MTPETRWNRMLPPAQFRPNEIFDKIMQNYAMFEFPDKFKSLFTYAPPEPHVTIRIFRDLDDKTSPRVRAMNHSLKEFEIHLNKNATPPELDGFEESHILAHELGHIVAALCHMPAAQNDWRFQTQIGNPNPPPRYSGELPAEKEAWDVAKQVHDAAFEYSRRNALNSYVRAEKERNLLRHLSDPVEFFGWDKP